MREQVCTYMCPWPRIQGAMLDEDSLVVTYRARPRRAARRAQARRRLGRPRRLHRLQPVRRRLPDGHRHPRRPAAGMHHLRALHRCLRRRDGEDRPPQGLIAYDTARQHGPARPRASRRACAWCVRAPSSMPRSSCIVGAVHALRARHPVGRSTLDVLRDRNPLFVTLSNGDIRNGYTLKILNKRREPRRIALAVEGLAGASVEVIGGDGRVRHRSAARRAAQLARVRHRAARHTARRVAGPDLRRHRHGGRHAHEHRNLVPGARAMSVATPRRLTGRQVLWILVAAFGVVFAVNGTMAWLAREELSRPRLERRLSGGARLQPHHRRAAGAGRPWMAGRRGSDRQWYQAARHRHLPRPRRLAPLRHDGHRAAGAARRAGL